MTTSLMDDRSSRLTEWLKDVASIMSDVKSWSESAGWLVHETQRPIEEEELGIYQAPVLQIKTPVDHLFVEPVALDVIGAEGRIDLYAWPSLYRAMLVREKGQWKLRNDHRIDSRKAWSRETFSKLVQDLTSRK